MTIQVPFSCEMLVDQNRFIGNDPIGRKCPNNAKYKLESGYLICEQCLTMLMDEPDRITKPPVALGEEGQKKMIHDALDSIRRRMHDPK